MAVPVHACCKPAPSVQQRCLHPPAAVPVRAYCLPACTKGKRCLSLRVALPLPRRSPPCRSCRAGETRLKEERKPTLTRRKQSLKQPRTVPRDLPDDARLQSRLLSPTTTPLPRGYPTDHFGGMSHAFLPLLLKIIKTPRTSHKNEVQLQNPTYSSYVKTARTLVSRLVCATSHPLNFCQE